MNATDLALVNGLLRRLSLKLDQANGLKEASVVFCRRSLKVVSKPSPPKSGGICENQVQGKLSDSEIPDFERGTGYFPTGFKDKGKLERRIEKGH